MDPNKDLDFPAELQAHVVLHQVMNPLLVLCLRRVLLFGGIRDLLKLLRASIL